MKKYLVLSIAALTLGACVGGGDKDMTSAQEAASPEALVEQAQQAYQNGDKAGAVQALEAAAAMGDEVALYNLSVLYRNGDGVAKDEQKAMNFLTQSAEKGYASALSDLGSFYVQQKNFQQAAPLLQAAAEQGNRVAQYNLGMMLYLGDGVEKNEELGVALIQQSAAQGFPLAQQALQSGAQK